MTTLTLPTSMRAARFTAADKSLRVQDVAVPTPGPNEVLVRVEACGVCLSDVHLIDGSLPGPLPEVTPGHEAAGTVASVGAEVAGWQPGDRVVLAGGRPCGRCASCVRGLFEECRAFEIMGFNYDGAWAQYVVVPAATLTSVPAGVPIEQAAVLADAVATPYAGLLDRAELRPGQSVGIWGIGGLGTHGIQIARLAGAAPLIAIDPLPSARERALRVGADVAFDPSDPQLAAEIFRLTGGAMLDLAVDMVGSNAVLAGAAGLLGRGGKVLMVGLSLDPVQLGPGLLFGLQSQTLLGHLGYKKRHLDELVRLVETGRLDLSGSISDVIDLEEVGPAGVDRLANKVGDPVRIVVRP